MSFSSLYEEGPGDSASRQFIFQLAIARVRSQNLFNAITVSTCQLCMKIIGRPTLTSLRMAEENHLHLCGSRTSRS